MSHTLTQIFANILYILVDYDLANRIIVVTLDNASANNAVIETFRPLMSGFHDELLH